MGPSGQWINLREARVVLFESWVIKTGGQTDTYVIKGEKIRMGQRGGLGQKRGDEKERQRDKILDRDQSGSRNRDIAMILFIY